MRRRLPDIGGQGLVGQALLQQLPAFIVAEEVRWLLARDERDGGAADSRKARSPAFVHSSRHVSACVAAPDV